MKTLWSIDIQAPPTRVWEELTRTGVVLPFYFDSILEGDLRPGETIRYVSANRKHVFIEGEVVEVCAPERFVHTFRFADLDEPEQRVSFELEANADGTRLTVRHDGLTDAPKHGRRVDAGWTKILADFATWNEHGRVALSTRARNLAMKLMLPLMPKAKPSAGAAGRTT